MSNEELQIRHEQLLLKITKMRHYQKEYFKHRVRSDLDKAKNYEREVDHLIDQELKKKKSNQAQLF